MNKQDWLDYNTSKINKIRTTNNTVNNDLASKLNNSITINKIPKYLNRSNNK